MKRVLPTNSFHGALLLEKCGEVSSKFRRSFKIGTFLDLWHHRLERCFGCFTNTLHLIKDHHLFVVNVFPGPCTLEKSYKYYPFWKGYIKKVLCFTFVSFSLHMFVWTFFFFFGFRLQFYWFMFSEKIILQFHLPKLEKSVVRKKVHEGVKVIM